MKAFIKPITVTLVVITLSIGFLFFRGWGTQSIETEQLPIFADGYVEYSDTNLISSKQKGLSILFFAATTWCQSCSALEDEILKRRGEIPDNITILKVDYDNDKKMKKKYFITVQHTLVVLDKDSNEITRWVGGRLDTLLQNIDHLL